jgi:hypothetical protein
MLTTSFVEIMDDILEFDGDLEKIPQILTKNDRLVFIGTIIFIISLLLIYRNKQN